MFNLNHCFRSTELLSIKKTKDFAGTDPFVTFGRRKTKVVQIVLMEGTSNLLYFGDFVFVMRSLLQSRCLKMKEVVNMKKMK